MIIQDDPSIEDGLDIHKMCMINTYIYIYVCIYIYKYIYIFRKAVHTLECKYTEPKHLRINSFLKVLILRIFLQISVQRNFCVQSQVSRQRKHAIEAISVYLEGTDSVQC